jgi:hypothetical protein
VRLSWSCPPEKNLNNLAKMASLCISDFQFFETADRQFTPFFVTKYKWKRTAIFFYSTHTQATSISGSPISMSLYFLLCICSLFWALVGLTGVNFSLHDKKLFNILTNKWILWSVLIRLLKIPLQPYNEKKFEVYYFRGKRRTSSKCLSSNNNNKNANLWDEKTIAFIILSLDEARHIFVTKRWKLQEVIGSICPQSIVIL